MTDAHQHLNTSEKAPNMIDAVIVGAGFSGLYMLHRLRQLGISARVFEAGDDLGGTWYWNRYPGARCDVESMQYSYSFCDDLQQEWHWSERYASQPEILRYLNHVADRFDLRKDIRFKTRVTAAIFDETLSCWEVHLDRGDRVLARFCIMATGSLSIPKIPDIKGLDSFKGDVYHTGQWPHEAVHFNDRRVAVIGTGSSGIQTIPVIAQQAAHVYVFQRTPNFSIPAYNVPLDVDYEQSWKSNYAERRRHAQESSRIAIAAEGTIRNISALEATPEERLQEYEKRWKIGGLVFLYAFNDLAINNEANKTAADFVGSKIRATVSDAAIAEPLVPRDHPIGTKRLCVDSHYYETYNRDNVTLISLRNENIQEITPTGIQTKNKTYDVDIIVFATGFDAMTGAVLKIDIRGRAGRTLREKWTEGPRTYLGLMTAAFPNLFIITGPGSPSVLTNMVVSIEQHVEWIAECLHHLRTHHLDSIEATVEAEDAWVEHVNDAANATLYPMANSWYVGANIPGKPRVFLPYIGGFALYRKKCEEVVSRGYEGFRLAKCS